MKPSRVTRRWAWVAAALAAVALLVPGGWWLCQRYSLRGRFDRVAEGMTEDEVRAVMGAPADGTAERWPPQVSTYAEVWRKEDGAFVRREYRGLDVHTRVGLVGDRYCVWRSAEGVVVVEYDGAGRVCGKVRLTE